MHMYSIKQWTLLLAIIGIFSTSFSALDTRSRAVKDAFKQSKKKEQIASKKKIEYKSNIVKQEQEKRAKMLAAATAAPSATVIRNVSSRLEIQKKGTQETAFWVDGAGNKMSVSITPIGTAKVPTNAFILGSFFDRNSKTNRIAYIAR